MGHDPDLFDETYSYGQQSPFYKVMKNYYEPNSSNKMYGS